MTVLVNKVYDDTNVSLIPADATAAAGYVDGIFRTWPTLVARFGHTIPLISITVMGGKARIADDEAGDMGNQDFPSWVEARIADKFYRPGPYTSVSNMDALAARLSHLDRSSYVLWSAHYTGTAHICGPTTCGECKVACDATQYTDRAGGQSLDETLAEPWFLAPPRNVSEVTVNVTVPQLSNGSRDPVDGQYQEVHRLQGLLVGIGKAWNETALSGLAIDGDFGPGTEAAVKVFQGKFGLTADGIVGSATWPALIQGKK